VVDANQAPEKIWQAILVRLDEVLESKGL